jgi:CPA2 family monovalent cation:H+ antiporter-2
MPHDMPLISALVVGLVLAFLLGLAANRLRMPPLVGYLLAGIVVGPHAFGLVADPAMGEALAAFGIILLMFGVGLHFSLRDLMGVRVLALVGALAQLVFATLLGLGMALLMGWGMGAGLLFGLALSSASALVVVTALKDRRLLETESGQIVSGWLIVQGIVMVLVLVLLPATAELYGTSTGLHDPFVSFLERLVGGPVGIWGALGLTIIKIAAFIGFMLIVGRRAIPWALHGAALMGSGELFTLAVLAMGLGLALGSSLVFGVPLALGAFLAGMIFSENRLSHRAATAALPLREAFSVLFFLGLGMMFDPAIIMANPLAVIATLLIIIIGKAMAAYGVVTLFGRPVDTGVTASAATAQIGEFSFILATMGVAIAILPAEALALIVAGIVISILFNPLVFWSLWLMRPRLEAQAAEPGVEGEAEPQEPPLAADGATRPSSTRSGHVVLVGYGAVGRVVADGLGKAGTPLVVIVDSATDATAARQAGLDVVVGNAASKGVLQLAGLEQAQTLLVAIGDGFAAGAVCRSGRKLNPKLRILARAASADEETHLRHLGADGIVRGEHEIGLGLLAWWRGERSDEAPPAAPVGPVFGPVENLLEKAASAPAVATSVAVPAAADMAIEAGDITVVPVPEVAIEQPPDIPSDPAPVESGDPVIIEAVEAAAPPDVIAMPPPAPAAQDDTATAPEGVEETVVEMGEAPAESEPTEGEGEAVVLPAPPEAAEPVQPEPVTEDSPPADSAAGPGEDRAAPEPAEKPGDAVPASPPAEPEPEKAGPPEPDKDKPGGVVPLVVPEPKP